MSRDLNEYTTHVIPAFDTDSYKYEEEPVVNETVFQMEAVEMMEDMFEEETRA